MSNDSYPRGFAFHDNTGTLQKIFFKSLKHRQLPVYGLSPVSHEDVFKEKHRSKSLSLSAEARSHLLHFFDAMLDDDTLWTHETYSAQLTHMNNIMWKQLFGDERGELVYLEMESVVRRLLLEKHLQSATDIYALLFDHVWREKFTELFSGIQGSHSETEDWGTHFFWYIDRQNMKRRRLLIEKDHLHTPERDIVIKLEPRAIEQGLRDYTLMPSSALSLLIIHEVEKLTCGGGPNQIHYLSQIRSQWKKLLVTQNKSTHTDLPLIWCGDATLFSVARDVDNASDLATLFDVFLYANKRSETVDTALGNTSVSSAVDAMIPALYTLYTRQPISRTMHTIPHLTIT